MIAGRQPARRALGCAIAFAIPFVLAGCAQILDVLPFLGKRQTPECPATAEFPPFAPKESKPGTPPTKEFAGARFTVKYPADWNQCQGRDKQVVLFEANTTLPDEVALGVIVATVTPGVPEEQALESYVSGDASGGGYVQEIKNKGLEVYSTGSATLAGRDARTVDHQIKAPGKTFKSRQIITIKGDTVYQLNFLVAPPELFEVWLQTATAMAGTLEIVD